MESRKINKYTIYSNGKIHDDFYDVDVEPFIHDGYLNVKLFIDTRYYQVNLQDLIAKIFMKDYNPSRLVCHIDGNIYNNDITNLTQMTAGELKAKQQADMIPNFRITRYDPYTMESVEFESFDEIILYMQSIGVEDEPYRIKLNIYTALDENKLVYNYKWKS